ncbi:MAG: endonuclease/exonuclease/phosphatase family protein [Verrucomicrobiota bacterium]|nr:endonuclease/exonuclease/phosphatase family protein [Verrucomicrobiota bacterium]
MTKLILFKIGLFGFFSIIANAQDVNNETSKPSLNNIIPKKNQKKFTTEDDQNLRLRILSYNIHHAEGVDGKLDVPRIAQVILSVDPDLVALQEVDKNTIRTGKVNQDIELSRLTKMNCVFGSNITFQGGQYGNAILSKFPIIKNKNFLLPNVDSGEQRGLLQSQIQISNKENVLFFSTHLDHRRSDRERLASAKAINQIISLGNKSPAILAGDFNDVPDSPTLKELGKVWLRSNKKILRTIPASKPSRQIDYIFVQPKERWKIIESQILDEDIASDHRAIFSIIELIK